MFGAHLPETPPAFIVCDSQVHRISREAEAAGGDDHAFLHNMVTSLIMACSVLYALSAFAVVTRNARLMVQTTTFQAIVAPGLALCGILLFGSSPSSAAGGQTRNILCYYACRLAWVLPGQISCFRLAKSFEIVILQEKASCLRGLNINFIVVVAMVFQEL